MKFVRRALCILLPLVGLAVEPAPPASVAAAARAFLGALTPEQQAQAVFAFTNDAQRVRWSNLPEGMYTRAGLRTGTLTAPQLQALHALLARALSPEGYRKAVDIMAGDEVCASRPGGRATEGTNFYFVSFLGPPASTNLWTLQFGGHHLALNATFRGDEMQLTPTLTGVNPGSWVGADGAVIRPLGDEYDLGFALLNSLDATQRAAAIIAPVPSDLVLGPGKDGVTLVPEGIPGSALNAAQQAALLNLVGEWVRMANEPVATARMAQATADLAHTFFAWKGPVTNRGLCYYRVQGPGLVLEFATQQKSTNHIHAMYRDLTNDYGKAWWR